MDPAEHRQELDLVDHWGMDWATGAFAGLAEIDAENREITAKKIGALYIGFIKNISKNNNNLKRKYIKPFPCIPPGINGFADIAADCC